MPHHLRLLGVFILILGFAGSASAQSFSNVVVFGDSLSDSGNAAAASGQPLPPGTSFTTNPDPVWAEIIAGAFGASGQNSLAGGPNYAWAGACVRPEGPCLNPVPTITGQIDQHLSPRNERADPDALYFIWAGLNDINDAFILDGDNVLTHTLAAAGAHTALIKRLQQAGARYIVVPNLPDLGRLPFAARLPKSFQDGITALGATYNEALYAGIREREEGVVPINILAIAGEIMESPRAYGFTNVTGTACPLNADPQDRTAVSLVCGPEGSGYPKTYAPGANENYLFADDKHPTGAGHAIIASLVTSTLAAPLQVSLAGEAGADAAVAHDGVISAERASDFALPVGSWRGYARGQFGGSDLGAFARLGESEADMTVITLGAGHRAGPDLSWGAALSIARHENELTGATLDSDVALGSLHGAWRSGGLEVSVALTLGQTSVDVERPVTLGAFTRVERGSTEAAQFGGEFDLGWTLGDSETLRHGPFFGLSLLNQEVKGFRENGNSSTAMNFSDFSRNSLIARGGYRFAWSVGGLRPYARIAYEHELEDDPILVSAGSNTMPGRFSIPGFTPSSSTVSTDLGVSAKLGERASGLLGYSGRFGEDSRRSHRLSLALRIVF